MATKKKKTIKEKIKTILENEKIINLDNLSEFLSKLKTEYFTPINTNITTLQTTKQEKLIAGNNIIIAADGKTISADVSSEGYVTKAYVDTQDEDVLQDAKDYTDNTLEDYATKDYVDTQDDNTLQDAKDYTDDELEDKVDKTNDAMKIYGTSNTGTQFPRTASNEASAGTIPLRYTDGRLKVGTPSDNSDATTKNYVDTGLSSKQGTLTAGANISISSSNVISAMGTFSDLPVGFTIQTMVDFDPSDYFGGEWLQITGKILRADSNTNTGGSDTHTLTTNEMPQHSHSFHDSNTPNLEKMYNQYRINDAGQGGFWVPTINGESTASKDFYINNSGDSQSFSNMMNYQNLYTYTKISLESYKKDGIKIKEK